jgi:glycosyltransferase involved in cell wall biosynthesis
MLKLSVLIPVYNEANTVLSLLDKVKSARIDIDKEILIGDDCSSDGTRDLLSRLPEDPTVKIFFLEKNVGRGGVIKHLWTKLSGDFVIHQDADLEYNPSEYQSLLAPILRDNAEVVYGSRFRGTIRKMRNLNMLGNRIMTTMCRFLYGLDVSDLMTCYKVYKASLIENLNIHSNGFDFEAEFTARLAQQDAKIVEVPISFVGRTFEEGKKIRAFDAVRVIRKLISCRIQKG